jgi:hypothetical protein
VKGIIMACIEGLIKTKNSGSRKKVSTYSLPEPGQTVGVLSLPQWLAACQECSTRLDWIAHCGIDICIDGLRFSDDEMPPGTLLRIGPAMLKVGAPLLAAAARVGDPLRRHLMRNNRAGVICTVHRQGSVRTRERVEVIRIAALKAAS